MTDLIEQCAEAAYESTFSPGVPHEPWANLTPHWQRIHRTQAKAVIDVLNPPTVELDPATDYDTDLFGEPA